MFLSPKASNVSRMQTAFCSYQESTRVNGRSLTLQPKALDSAIATGCLFTLKTKHRH